MHHVTTKCNNNNNNMKFGGLPFGLRRRNWWRWWTLWHQLQPVALSMHNKRN